MTLRPRAAPARRMAPFAVAVAFAALATEAGAASPSGFTHGVSNADLVAAAMGTPLRLIDYGMDNCRNDRTVSTWLGELTGSEAKGIRWSGGPCVLVEADSPMDSGSAWCARAEISLAHPRDRQDRPMIEIFFDAPRGGKPGAAYAFRGLIEDAGYLRFRQDFEAVWLERFPATADRVRCSDDQ